MEGSYFSTGGRAQYDPAMNFGRVSTGGTAGFLASTITGPAYVFSIVLAPGGGDVFELDVGLDTDLVLGIPLMMLSGLALAGLPSILLGMVLGAWIGDRSLSPQVVPVTLIVGAIGGAALLQSISGDGLTAPIAVRGAFVGSVTAWAWTRLFDFLRSRKPTVIVGDST